MILVRQKRLENADPRTILPLPQIWANYTLQDVANAVHSELPGYSEYPGTNPARLIANFLAEDVPYDRTIITTKSQDEFIRGPIMLADMNTHVIGTVGPINFSVKWFVAR